MNRPKYAAILSEYFHHSHSDVIVGNFLKGFPTDDGLLPARAQIVSIVELDRHVGGPLLTKWGNHYLVGGRKSLGGAPAVTSLYELIGDQLQEIAEFPSGGDNSYPGFVELSPTEGLLSYYSSHEGSGTSLAPSAIYLVKLSLN